MKEQAIQISMRRTFQAKKTSTKATKQDYAMLRINYDEKRDKLRGCYDNLEMKMAWIRVSVMEVVRNCHIQFMF